MTTPSPTGNHGKAYLVSSLDEMFIACWAVCGLSRGDADSVSLELHFLRSLPDSCYSYGWNIKARGRKGLNRPPKFFHDLAEALLLLKLSDFKEQPMAELELQEVTPEQITAALLLKPSLADGIAKILGVSKSEELSKILGTSDLGDYEVTQLHKD